MTLYKIVKDLIYSYRGNDADTIYAMVTERLKHSGLSWEDYKKAVNLLGNELTQLRTGKENK